MGVDLVNASAQWQSVEAAASFFGKDLPIYDYTPRSALLSGADQAAKEGKFADYTWNAVGNAASFGIKPEIEAMAYGWRTGNWDPAQQGAGGMFANALLMKATENAATAPRFSAAENQPTLTGTPSVSFNGPVIDLTEVRPGVWEYVPPGQLPAPPSRLALPAPTSSMSLAAPAEPALLGQAPTSLTLGEVMALPQPAKWRAGEVYVQELYGSPGQRLFPTTWSGGRIPDAPVDLQGGGVLSLEVKTYNRWITVEGDAIQRSVPLSPRLQQQIFTDIWLRRNVPGYDPRWIFLGAPPSVQLSNRLRGARIVSVVHER